MTVKQLVWHDTRSDALPDNATLEVAVKIRYHHRQAPATLVCQGTSGRVLFNQPQYAVTPGQAAVFYHGPRVLGSAIIQ